MLVILQFFKNARKERLGDEMSIGVLKNSDVFLESKRHAQAWGSAHI